MNIHFKLLKNVKKRLIEIKKMQEMYQKKYKKSYNKKCLPEISPDDKKLGLSVQELRSYLSDYLTKKELDIINLFFYPNDNAQIIRILQKQEPDTNPGCQGHDGPRFQGWR